MSRSFFIDWFTSEDFSEQVRYLPRSGEPESISLYAKWTPILYALTYELNGGTNSPDNPRLYTIEDSVTLAPATREGFSFAGLFSNAGLNQEFVGLATGSTGNRTTYDGWGDNPKETRVEKVSIYPASISLHAGDTQSFRALVQGTNHSSAVSWSIENAEDAETTIDSEGTLTVGNAETADTIEVVATSKDDITKKGKALVVLTNTPVFVQSLEIGGAQGATSIEGLGNSLQMEVVSIEPQDATNKLYTWYCEETEGAAAISSEGVLTGYQAGKVLVTAVASDGSGIPYCKFLCYLNGIFFAMQCWTSMTLPQVVPHLSALPGKNILARIAQEFTEQCSSVISNEAEASIVDLSQVIVGATVRSLPTNTSYKGGKSLISQDLLSPLSTKMAQEKILGSDD